jgi:hypothetical protein
MIRNIARVSRLALAFGLLTAVGSALASAPFWREPVEIWLRTEDGEVLYAAATDEKLSALCVDVAGTPYWVSEDFLSDVAFPELGQAKVVHGMGFGEVLDYIPDWGLWGLSVEVHSHLEVNGSLRTGPEYFFVLRDGRPLYRVRRSRILTPNGPGASTSSEEWAEIPASALRASPCVPPSRK